MSNTHWIERMYFREYDYVSAYVGFPGGSVVKNPPAK